jgi:hypothetical protein
MRLPSLASLRLLVRDVQSPCVSAALAIAHGALL